MTDDITNPAREARKARANLRGATPTAPVGSAAEAMGYASGQVTRLEPRTGPELHSREVRHQWLRKRLTGVGSADIAVLMGWGFADQSVWELYARKTGMIGAGDDSDRPEFEYGRRLEPVLRDWFQDVTGLYVGREQEHYVHPDHAHHLATPDGTVYDHPVDPKTYTDDGTPHGRPTLIVAPRTSDPLGGVEFKTTTDSARQWDDEGVPLRYQCQCQWQMHVCGWSTVWLAVLHGRVFRTYQVPRDEDDIATLVAVADTFWNDHVIPRVPPPVDGNEGTTRALNAAYHGGGPSPIMLPDHAGTLTALRIAKANLTAVEAEVDRLTNELRAAMGDAESADFGRGIEVTWSRFDRKSVDLEALKTGWPDVFDAVSRKSPSSRFTVKDPSKIKPTPAKG